ncbi:MAG: transcriptional repressor [Methanomassiliicoccales archaeon]|nr:transcriptional repressor [Methanomassiliicoccales archaeon]
MSSAPNRWTKQLKVIVDIVYGSHGPMTADEVYHAARARLPNISLGTVYRNLNKLESEGLVSEVTKGNTTAFVKHPFSNATFECEVCGRLFCVPYDLRNSEMERKVGMKVNRWSIRMTGVCKECERKCI